MIYCISFVIVLMVVRLAGKVDQRDHRRSILCRNIFIGGEKKACI